MLAKDLRKKNNNELMKLFEDLKAELFTLKFKNKTGQLDKTHKIPVIKKDIAKVLTILNGRKLNLEKQDKSTKTALKNDKIGDKESKLKKSKKIDKKQIEDKAKNER